MQPSGEDRPSSGLHTGTSRPATPRTRDAFPSPDAGSRGHPEPLGGGDPRLTKRFGATTAVNDVELLVPRGSDVIAEISRALGDGGIPVYRLQPVQTSLDSWFLQVTSRLEDAE